MSIESGPAPIRERFPLSPDPAAFSEPPPDPDIVLAEPKGFADSPEEVLKRLKGYTGQERKEAVAEYRDFLHAQREALAFFYHDMTRIIQEYPTAAFEDLYQMTMQKGNDLKLDYDQKHFARRILRSFDDRRKEIALIRTAFPDNADLYQAVFKRRPIGNVSVVATSAILMFRCTSFEDYSYAFNNGKPNEKGDEAAAKSGGAQLNDSRLGRLEGAITIERVPPKSRIKAFFNKKEQGASYSTFAELPPHSRAIAIHEEQHAIHRLFTDVTSPSRFRVQEPGRSDTPFIQGVLREGRKLRADIADDRARTEMLAYFSDGTSRETVEEYLLREGGIYNYLDENALQALNLLATYVLNDKAFIEERAPTSEEIKKIPEAIKHLFDEYVSDVHEALDALYALNGKYPPNVITAHLIHEPIQRWRRISGELLSRAAVRA